MKFLKFVALIFILGIFFISHHFDSNAPVTVKEIYRQDEAEQTKRSVENFLHVLEENKTSYVARGAHSKGHACVKAYFDISKIIPAELQHGVFQIPGKRYKSWIRFSNGRSSMKTPHDADKDAHGMAIKLFNIYDNKLTKVEGASDTQEFLMHDTSVFFAANVEDYNRFVESEDKILYFFSGTNPFEWNIRELFHGLATLKEAPTSPLWGTYFSNTAYKLGSHNIKFSAQSCTSEKNETKQDKTDADFLRKTMAQELSIGKACFNFRVQLQKKDKYMPIEDPSIEWKESDSPYISIATITIPNQSFDTKKQQDFCENLAFSPWNSLDEHRPIGELNRIRKKVYQASSDYRHKENKREIPTNLAW
jgi:catalase